MLDRFVSTVSSVVSPLAARLPGVAWQAADNAARVVVHGSNVLRNEGPAGVVRAARSGVETLVRDAQRTAAERRAASTPGSPETPASDEPVEDRTKDEPTPAEADRPAPAPRPVPGEDVSVLPDLDAPAGPPAEQPDAAVESGAPGVNTAEATGAEIEVAAGQGGTSLDGTLLTSADLPLADWDHLTVGSLRGRLRSLTVEDLVVLRAYESAHADRLQILTMLENRIAKLRREEAEATSVEAPASTGGAAAGAAEEPEAGPVTDADADAGELEAQLSAAEAIEGPEVTDQPGATSDAVERPGASDSSVPPA